MKYLKTYEQNNKYNIGDYVEVKFWGYDVLTDETDEWIYILHIDGIDGIKYYGTIINKNIIETFTDKEIVRKVPKSEANLLLNINKYNL